MKLLDILDKKLTEKLDATHHKADILEEGTEILEYEGCHVLYLEHNISDFYSEYSI